MNRYREIADGLSAQPKRWLVTGAAGFIGSALVETLLSLGQEVIGVDNLLTGHQRNIDDVKRGCEQPQRLSFVIGDLCDADVCNQVVRGVDVILHQAALGSVPRSLETPDATHRNNVDAFVNLLVAAKDADVSRVVYASSSSVYGDNENLPKVEDKLGEPMSPYAASKRVAEIYARVFQRSYGLQTIGLRYFNVFGRRQDPAGPYAAVIPKWIQRLTESKPCDVYGDGHHSRDFCYVDNVVQANILAATAEPAAAGRIFNVGAGGNTNLLALFELLRGFVAEHHPDAKDSTMRFLPERPGDVPHSQASIEAISNAMGYQPSFDVKSGLRQTVAWFVEHESPTRNAT